MRISFATILSFLGLAFVLVAVQAACDSSSQAIWSDRETDDATFGQDYWIIFKGVMDAHVADEKNGAPPGGGEHSWEDTWTEIIRLHREDMENPDKYVEYIIEARSAAGLPDLPKGTTAEPAPGEGEAVIIPDTPELWHEFVVAIDWEVSREKSGGPPPGGVQSWTESWTGTLRGLRKGSQENPEKYVEYIIEARSAAGLPDLPHE